MALQKTVTTLHDFEATNAYHRVEAAILSTKTELSFHVRSYKNKDAAVAFCDASYRCAYDIAGNNPIKQAYEHLKTLPEFSGATDV